MFVLFCYRAFSYYIFSSFLDLHLCLLHAFLVTLPLGFQLLRSLLSISISNFHFEVTEMEVRLSFPHSGLEFTMKRLNKNPSVAMKSAIPLPATHRGGFSDCLASPPPQPQGSVPGWPGTGSTGVSSGPASLNLPGDLRSRGFHVDRAVCFMQMYSEGVPGPAASARYLGAC